jgi:uncharacterized protein with NRDE domain
MNLIHLLVIFQTAFIRGSKKMGTKASTVNISINCNSPNMMLADFDSHPRDKHVRLTTEGHQYVVHGNITEYLSTSTFLDCFFPPVDADKVIAGMRQSRKWSKSEYYSLTDQQIKGKWTKAQQLGTELHECIERWINKQDPSGDERNCKGFALFRDFEKTWVVPQRLEPYRTE